MKRFSGNEASDEHEVAECSEDDEDMPDLMKTESVGD